MFGQSLARVFYEKAVAGGPEFLRQLVADKTPEGEWLDFKSADHLDEAETKVTWSRALCGFANNEGGVLVWGIDARLDKVTGVDVACGVKPVPHPEALRDRLRQLHPTATDPPLVGVESTAIFDNGNDGAGYVVSYVPESQVKPHRAELMEGKPYILRIGDRFTNPSPAILRNLFFPRASTRLRIAVQADWQGIERNPGVWVSDIEILYRMTIHNAGVATAKELFVIVDIDPLANPIETPYGSTQAETPVGTGIVLTRPLHPSSSAPLCALRQRVSIGTRTSTGESLIVPRPTRFAAEFQIFAADMQPVRLRVALTEWNIDHKEQVWAVPHLG